MIWCKRSLAPVLAVGGIVLVMAACGDGDGTQPVDNAPTVALLSPNGGTAFEPGSSVQISWTAADDGTIASADVAYTADGQATPVTIAAGLPGTATSQAWTTPAGPLYGMRIQVTVTDDANQTGTDESDAIFAVVDFSDRGYVTSGVCQDCHSEKYDDLFNSGHPFKLNEVVGGQPPTYPNSDVPDPPTGFTWNDITYVIGGFGWKARFMDSDGYIITDGWNGVTAQYNLPRDDLGGGLPAEWVPYHAADIAPKPYTCGSCHTTGWLTTADNGGVNQDGLEGILGTWEEPGIRCEQCHGPGIDHVTEQTASAITVDPGAELCGSCHFRDTNHNILASGGFVRHHEQYDELLSAGKQSFDCSTCHEPHIGVRYGAAAMGGIIVTCESCHSNEATNNAHLVPVDCESCHMARATKSARAVNTHEGDLRTHIFNINPAEVDKTEMFFVDPTSGSTHTRGFVTLDFACYGCHNDPLTGEGGGGSDKTLAELAAKAAGIHN